MRLRLLWLLGLLTCVTCCVMPGYTVPPRVPYDGAAFIHFHADTSFQPYERRWLAEVAGNLARQSNNLVNVIIDFDVDFYDDDSLRATALDDLLLKVESSAPQVIAFDAQHCCLLGLTMPSRDDARRGTLVLLVTDRLTEHDTFVSTAMHEILHALGLQHTRGSGDLMYPYLNGAPTCLSRGDIAELCRVYGCNVEKIGYCGS